MKRPKIAVPLMILFLFQCAYCAAVLGQHGTAPGGYYPPDYGGDTFTGLVTATDDSTREITLTYSDGKKTETFTGILKKDFVATMKDGSTKELNPSGIRKGVRIMVFYTPKTKKVEGKKVKYYEIFQFGVVEITK